MEALLNCLWIVVSVALAVLCLRRTARGRMRVSTITAIGCVLLIALLLFPAISASDDLMGRPSETLHGHGRFYVLASAVDLHTAIDALQIAFLLATMAAIAVLLSRIFALGNRQPASAKSMYRGRPSAVRPPPARGNSRWV